MPKITDQLIETSTKKFKPKKYRAWDPSGTGTESIAPTETSHEVIILVDPNNVKKWAKKDRNVFELGDIDALGEDMKTHGQKVPAIVRPCSDNDYKYELIAGERRWLAAKKVGIQLAVIVRTLDEKNALIEQILENSRKDLSDYSRGISYGTAIAEGLFTQLELEKILGMSKAWVSNILAFYDLKKSYENEWANEKNLWNEVQDLSRVGGSTAARIRALSNKGPEYRTALLTLVDDIRNGIGNNELDKKLINIISCKSQTKKDDITRIVNDEKGRHMFTWKNEAGKNASIVFPKEFCGKLHTDRIEQLLLNELISQLGESVETFTRVND